MDSLPNQLEEEERSPVNTPVKISEWCCKDDHSARQLRQLEPNE